MIEMTRNAKRYNGLKGLRLGVCIAWISYWLDVR
jgi:hypothetical protein